MKMKGKKVLHRAIQAILMVIPAALGPTGVSAQKVQDRHPAMVEPVPLTFEQRWAPVREMMVRQSLIPPAEQIAPAPAAAPVEPRRVRTVMVTIRKPDQETCKRHGRRTVWNGNSWSCRR